VTGHILAGDIGGTKTILALFSIDDAGLTPGREAQFKSRDFSGLEQMVEAFLARGDEAVGAAAFGIAGPVLGGRVEATNLPWEAVELDSLARAVGLPADRVRLMNDLESTAFGALFLPEDRIQVLNPGTPRPGNIAVIAAGTGLGQAFLFRDGARYRPSATEGGHVGFAPRDGREDALLGWLRGRYGHVSFERVLSGPGLYNLFDFLHTVEERSVSESILERMKTEDPSAVIGEAGVKSECPVCEEAVDWFVSLYGYQAANLALSVLALGGVFIGGGIVTKLLPKMTTGTFLRAFTRRERFERLLGAIPIRIILDPRTSLLGAAEAARELR
jgi:glucokinase